MRHVSETAPDVFSVFENSNATPVAQFDNRIDADVFALAADAADAWDSNGATDLRNTLSALAARGHKSIFQKPF